MANANRSGKFYFPLVTGVDLGNRNWRMSEPTYGSEMTDAVLMQQVMTLVEKVSWLESRVKALEKEIANLKT